MVSKNNKHGKPKKKYKKRRTSFRNNKKNINLRSKSLKNSKGGAVGDNPSDFGLPDNTAIDIPRLKTTCDRLQSLNDSDFNPRSMSINYQLPRYTIDSSGKPVKNNAQLEIARKTRVACYTYYKRAFQFSLSDKAKILFKGEKARLANELYGSYNRLLLEDSSDIKAIKDKKNDYLIACVEASKAKRAVEMAVLNYIRKSTPDTLKKYINSQYKQFIRREKVKINKQLRNTTDEAMKKKLNKLIQKADSIIALDNPLESRSGVLRGKTAKNYLARLNAIDDKQSELQLTNSGLLSDFSTKLTLVIGAQAILNLELENNGLEHTIVEPPQWFERTLGEGDNAIDLSTLSDMIPEGERDQFELMMFGKNASSNISELSRSISQLSSSSHTSTDLPDIPDVSASDDLSIESFISGTRNTNSDGEEGEEMQEIVSSALDNVRQNIDSYERYEWSDDDEPPSSVVPDTSNVSVPKVTSRNIRELEGGLESLQGASFTTMGRSSPPPPPPKEEGEIRPAETPIPAPPPYSDDRKEEGEIRPVEVPESPPEELTVKFGVRDYPTTKLIATLFKQAVRDEDENVVIDKEMKSWFKKNKQYKSCNEKDAEKLLTKIKTQEIPSLRQLLATDLQKINDNEDPIYTAKPGKVFVVDERLQACGGILDVLEDKIDSRQKGLIMSVPQLSWVWKNVAKKDEKMQDEAVCFYKTFIGYCNKNNIQISSKDQCNIPPDWDPDTNNLCKDTVDANKATQDAMDRASKQEEAFNKKRAEEESANAKYQAELADYNDKKTKHDAAKNKPPTSDDVYAYINEASTGQNPGPVPGVPAPGPEPPKDPIELDSTSQLQQGEPLENLEGDTKQVKAADVDPANVSVIPPGSDTSHIDTAEIVNIAGGNKNPIIEATLAAMSQFGGANGSTNIELDVFSKCTAKKCKTFFSKCRDKEEFKPYWANFGGLSDEEASRLGGLDAENQDGLVVSLPQFDKVYNNKALTSTDKEKACLRCLYMGFINLCKARGIDLDPELQPDITKDYKPGDIKYSIESDGAQDDEDNKGDDASVAPPVAPTVDPTSSEKKEHSDDDEIATIGSDDGDDDDDDDDLRVASGDKKKKRPKGSSLSDLPDAGNNPKSPIQIITDTRKKDKYIWIKIRADPDCLTGVVDNTYDTSEATLKKLINHDDEHVHPSAPPAPDTDAGNDGSDTKPNTDGSGTDRSSVTPSAPPYEDASETTSSVSKPSKGSTSDEPASDLINPKETKPEPTAGGCDNVPDETELRSAPPPGKAKKNDLFCPSQAPYLCGKKTITYQERLKNGLGAACRVKEHDCNSRKMPVGDSDTAKRVYQAADPETGLTARFYVDPEKDPGDITSCSKKTKGGKGKKNRSLKKRGRKKRNSIKSKN